MADDVESSDLYARLGVASDASAAEIKASYRRLALKHHPDKSSDPHAKERFQAIATAFAVLSDPAKRGAYDQTGDESLVDLNLDLDAMDRDAASTTTLLRGNMVDLPR